MAMEHSPNSDAKVLLVDDEEGIRTILRRVLLRAGIPGHQIREASSAEEALTVLATESFSLVMSDFRMGVKTGVELLAWIYQNHPTTLRVLMTGYNEETIAIDAINGAKVDAYIKKPWDNAKLSETIQDLLKEQRARTQREQAVAHAVSLAARMKGQDKGTIRRL